MEKYCIYLRKSRADAEAEQRGEGETLARHERALVELANNQKLNVLKTHKEIISGETISARPVMQQLLFEVESGMWDGVLVMEIERLARGDSIDQGIIAQVFKCSDTKIITPSKTYNPNNEFDEEYFEFGLFMSRREYKVINRRLQRGRLASVKEGKFVGNISPYGYKRIKLVGQKGYSLEPTPEEANTVKLIFEWYAYGEQDEDGTFNRFSRTAITKKLNSLGMVTRKGVPWTSTTLKDILRNPVYIGKIRWNYRPNRKHSQNGKIVTTRPINVTSCILVDGLHLPIISQGLWNRVQQLLADAPPTPVPAHQCTKNSLAGLIKCAKCGHTMQRRPYAKKEQPDSLICTTAGCDNVSSALYLVEERILGFLDDWMEDDPCQWKEETMVPKNNTKGSVLKWNIEKLHKEIELWKKQKEKAYDCLEKNIYTPDIFQKRIKTLSEKIKTAESMEHTMRKELLQENKTKKESLHLIPTIDDIISVYAALPDAKSKNQLLKEVIEKVEYLKTVNGRWHNSPDEFELTIYPKLSKKNVAPHL